MPTHLTRYGILDDAGQVVRWVTEQPKYSAYTVQRIAIEKRATTYQIALRRLGEAPF